MVTLNSKKIHLLLNNPKKYHDIFNRGVDRLPKEDKTSWMLYDMLFFPKIVADKYIKAVAEPEDSLISEYCERYAERLYVEMRSRGEIREEDIQRFQRDSFTRLGIEEPFEFFTEKVHKDYEEYIKFCIAKKGKTSVDATAYDRAIEIFPKILERLEPVFNPYNYVNSEEKILPKDTKLEFLRPPMSGSSLGYVPTGVKVEKGLEFHGLTLFHDEIINVRKDGTRKSFTFVDFIGSVYFNEEENTATIKLLRLHSDVTTYIDAFVGSETEILISCIMKAFIHRGIKPRVEVVVIDDDSNVYNFEVSEKTRAKLWNGFTKILEKVAFHIFEKSYNLPFDYEKKKIQL